MPENQSFLVLTNESIFKNSEEIRIDMTFDGSKRKEKKGDRNVTEITCLFFFW